MLIVEWATIAAIVYVLTVFTLGWSSDWFSGWSEQQQSLFFAATVLSVGLSAAALFWAWSRARQPFQENFPIVPLMVALSAGAALFWASKQPAFQQEVRDLQTLVGAKMEVEKAALAHQVYAHYRRANHSEMLTILERATVFEKTVEEAAKTFSVDPEVLIGIAAVESSFYPRESKDGGRGLFQITRPPKAAVTRARDQLRKKKLDTWNQRHNAYVGAATFQQYLKEMGGDLFLGLLAYNIGPKNGGLVSIMKQYGARDFVTIQPYLKNLPRDYPIRVLSAALSYRLLKKLESLPAYQDDNNAKRIQQIGIPGLQAKSTDSETDA